MNKLWVDVETTGLRYYENEIIQLAYLIDIDDKIVDEGNIFIKPNRFDTIDLQALSVSNTTLESFNDSKYMNSKDACKKLLCKLSEYNISYNNRFMLCCYNNRSFDDWFIREFIRVNLDKPDYKITYKYFYNIGIDVITLLPLLEMKLGIQTKHKLTDLCDYFKIPIKAHDAMSDIKATYIIFKIVATKLGLI